MVFFNDPLPIHQPARRAVEMAFAMQETPLKLSARWKKKGYVLGLGIGIAQGYATVGCDRLRGAHRLRRNRHRHQPRQPACDLSEPGDILVSQRVHAESRNSSFADDWASAAPRVLRAPCAPTVSWTSGPGG
jgi:adenylate cyclase